MIHTIDLKFKQNDSAIGSFLVETEQGPILIETGPHSTYPNLKIGIEKAGYKASEIKHVFLSHIHLDHAGAAWVFAEMGAKIYVHPRGAKHLISPERLMSSAKRIYQDQMDTLWGQMNPIPKEKVVICEDQCEYDFGNVKLKGWYTPGHAVHHIAWQMGTTLFSGDVAGVRINNGMIVAPCPPPDINIEDWVDSINLIRGLDLNEIYLTHFNKITDIEDHLNILENRLNSWAAWIKPHFDNGTEVHEIIPLFSKYVIDELKEFGIDENGITQYEAANPAWMSVAGLLRYWKKKKEREESNV